MNDSEPEDHLPPVVLRDSLPRPIVVLGSTVPPPLAPIPQRTPVRATFGIRTVDTSGRVFARTVLHALNWAPGTTLAIDCVDEEILVMRPASGPAEVVVRDYLYLPAIYRRRLGIEANDQLLLVADPSAEVLLVGSVRLIADVLGDRITGTETR